MMNIFKRKDNEKLEDLLGKDVGYYKFQGALKRFIIEKINEIGFTSPEYKISCIFRDYHGSKSEIKGLANDVECRPEIKNRDVYISINKKLTDAFLFSGTNDCERYELFVVIFHELHHLMIAKMFMDGLCDNQTLIKDKALEKYFYNETGHNKYYSYNYDNCSEEALCNIYGINEAMKFFRENDIELTQEENIKLREFYDSCCDKLMDTSRIDPTDNKTYTQEELYEKYILGNNLKR